MRKIFVLTIFTMLIILSTFTIVYAEGTTLKIDNAFSVPGKTVDVPITISNNFGIAGAVIKISYDARLELTAIKKGEAFSSLTYTPPAKLTSNPVTLLWDGMDGDISNGTIAILSFAVPDDANGKYQISITYEVGGIYDEDLNDIEVAIENGSINIVNNPCLQVNVSDTINVKLISPDNIEGNINIALYGFKNELIDMKIYPASESMLTNLEEINSGAYIKVFWWDTATLKPYCSEETVKLY